MEKEKLQHYSIRKLSVGAASVLIGLSFVGLGHATQVKADTVSGSQQQLVETSKPKSESTEKAASLDDNQVNNQSLNDGQGQAQAVNVVESQKSVRGGSEQLNASSETQNETPDNSSKAATALRTSENEEKVVENNKNKVETTTLNLNQKVDPKVTRANLVESKVQAQDNNDLNVQKDPSKLSVDKFVDGTHWTPAGWTRTDENTKTAKSSSFDINWRYQENIDKNTNKYISHSGDGADVNVGKITFTIDKNDMKQGNSILINAIQQVPTTGKQSSQSDLRPYQTGNAFADMPAGSVMIKDKAGQDMGYLTVDQLDNAELDLYFHPTKTLNDLAMDPTFSYDFSSTNRSFSSNVANSHPKSDESYSHFYNRNHHLQFPLHYSVLTSSDVLNYDIDFSKTFDKQIALTNGTQQVSNWGNWDEIGQKVWNTENQVNNSKSISGFVYKIQAIHGNPITINWAGIDSEFNIFDANGNLMSEQLGNSLTGHEVYNPKQEKDGLSNTDLWNITPDNDVRWSRQKDGSVFVCSKLKPTEITVDKIKEAVNSSYLGNIQDPEHYQQILDNTIKNTKSWGYYDSRVSTGAANIGQVDIVTDVTPSFVGTPNLGTFRFAPGYQDGNSQAELETYRNAAVKYIDDTTNQNITNDSIIGRKNQSNDYIINIPLGYVLSNNQDGTNYKWNDDRTKVTYTFADDQRQNDSNPIVIHLTHGRKDIVDSNVIAETIHYNYADGSKAADDYVAKHVVSSRVGHKDLVTGETIWDSDWSTETFPEVTSPHINGYTANQPEIGAQTVDGNSQDIVKTVIYNANNQKIFIHYIDDDATKGQELHIEPLVGKSNTTDSYTTGDAIKNYLNQGYDLVSDDTQGKTLRYDADDEHDQNYNVHLKHHISDVTDPKLLNATFDRIVTEKLPDGQSKQFKQHYVINRTGKQDQVTKKYTFGNWSSAQVHEDQGDKIDGYTAVISNQNPGNIAKVKDGIPVVRAEIFTNTNDALQPVNTGEIVEITYSANDQKAIITFIDDDVSKENNVLQTKNLVGKSNTESDYNTGSDIEEYLRKGYDLVSDSTNGKPIIFDTHDKEDQTFEVHLKHHISDVTDPRILTATFDRAITEHTPDGKDKQITQHYVITRTGKQDQVTKQYNFSDWIVANVHEDKLDNFKGYTAHINSAKPDDFITIVDGVPTVAKAEQFTNENGKLLPKNVSETADISYTANPQSAAIVYIDDTADKVLSKIMTTGYYGEAIDFTPTVSSVIDDFVKKGYVLVSNDFDGQKYDADNNQNIFDVHLKHGTMDVTRSKDVTETIHYVYDNNSKAHDDYVTTKKFENHGVKDLVTGETKWNTNWTPENDQFAQVNSPEIPGYTADKTSIPAQTVNADSKNLEYTVTYTQTPAPTPYEPSDPVQPAQPSTPVVPDQPNVPDTDQQSVDNNAPKKAKHHNKSKDLNTDSNDDYGNTVNKSNDYTGIKTVKITQSGKPVRVIKINQVKSETVDPVKSTVHVKSQLPKTGSDKDQALVALGLASASLSGLLSLGLRKKKEEN